MATVSELITQQTASVNSTAAQADLFLQSLVNIANVAFSDGFNIDRLLPNEYDYNTVPQIDFPLTGATGTVGTIAGTPPPSPPTPAVFAVEDIVVPDFLSTDLTAPTAVFSYFEQAYESVLLDPLKAKLLADLAGGYGIETADEVALFNRARDREIAVARARIDEAGRLVASRGFPLPPGELSLAVDSAWQEMQDKVSSASRDIMLERSRLYVENRRFTIEQTRELEQLLIGFHNSVQERALNVSKATVELAVALYNAQLTRFRAWLDQAKVASDVQLARLQIQYEQARTFFEGYRAQITGYEANVRREIETVRAQNETYRANIDNARMLNDGRAAQANLQAKVIEATQQQNNLVTQLAIETAKAKLLATVEALKFRTASVQYGSEKFYALLTSMVGTINTLATQSETAT